MNQVARLAVLGGLLMLGTSSAAVLGQTFSGQVLDVKDGDTITVLRGTDSVRVQLHGLDAPERGQSYGETATAFLQRQVEGEEVRVRVRDRDRYGRLVATVLHGGTDVNEQMLRAGLAWYDWWYVDYTPDAARDQRLEFQAQRAERGLWSQPTPIPPWEWRDERHAVARDASGPSGLRYDTEGRPRDCADFSTQPAAQRFLETALPDVTEELDPDGDGRACETLPAE